VSGFGTVVTGTLIDGTLGVGQQVEMVPSGRPVRIRGLQTHRQKLETAIPGSRVAVNLSGVSHNEIARGEVLTTPGWLRPTMLVDVKLRMIKNASRSLRHNTGVVFYSYTSECEARVRLLEGSELQPGEEGWAQVHLSRPVPLVKDDYFVLRSPESTLGGGQVIDAHPRRHRRGHAPTLERLAALEAGTLSEALAKALEARSPLTLAQLAQQANVPAGEVRTVLGEMAEERLAVVLPGPGGESDLLAYSSAAWSRMVNESVQFLKAYHVQHPMRVGAPREEVRSRLGLKAQAFNNVLDRMLADGVMAQDRAYLRMPDHSVALTGAQKRLVEQYLRSLLAQPFSPPTDQKLDADLLAYLVDEGMVVRMEEGVVFHAEAYRQAVEKVTGYLREHGKATAAELRDLLGTTRKYIMPLLTYMDTQRITRRVGDDRVLR
jgi:selenocysteine-specific elongation factor